MASSSLRTVTLKGGLSAAGVSSSPATLTANANELVITAFLHRYRFEPQQVIALDSIGLGTLKIQHTVEYYPSTIHFWTSTPRQTASDMIGQIRRKGFIPQALADELPRRQGLGLRFQTVIPILLGALLIIITEIVLGWFQMLPYPAGGQYAPVGLGCLFLVCLGTRYSPILKNIVLHPGRHVGEILPIIDTFGLIFGILAIVNIILILRLPTPFAIALAIGTALLLMALYQRLTQHVSNDALSQHSD